MFYIFLLWGVCALTYLFAKKILLYSNPAFIVAFRMMIAGGLLLGYKWFVDAKSVKIKRKDLPTFFYTGIFLIFITSVVEFWAMQYISILKSTLLFSVKPFMVAFLAYFLISERLSRLQFVGMTIGFAGLMPTLLAKASGKELAMEFCRISLPEVAYLFGVASDSFGWFFVLHLMKKKYKIGTINGYAMLVAGVLSMVLAFGSGNVSNPVGQWWPFLGWLAALLLGGNFFFYNFFSWLLRRYSITFLSFTGFLCPCFASIFEYFFMEGDITWHYFLSLGVITLGLYLFYREELGRERGHSVRKE